MFSVGQKVRFLGLIDTETGDLRTDREFIDEVSSLTGEWYPLIGRVGEIVVNRYGEEAAYFTGYEAFIFNEGELESAE